MAIAEIERAATELPAQPPNSVQTPTPNGVQTAPSPNGVLTPSDALGPVGVLGEILDADLVLPRCGPRQCEHLGADFLPITGCAQESLSSVAIVDLAAAARGESRHVARRSA